ncbi:MAG TPA: alpha/beta hydrolase [Vicinamibacterales bacterium]|nr:alpha/beta hydrolase [Vicinamibacterales bacterium]
MSAGFPATVWFAAAGMLPLSAANFGAGQGRPAPRIERKTCVAPDGVTIVYSVAGRGETTLVFVHGGLADRTFYDRQLTVFADRYRVIALDLAGHGESGTNRKKWGVPEFGADVKAVVDAEQGKQVVLFGNSLGGPVAIEAALLMPGRVIGVVGIDTFQDLGHPDTPEYRREESEFMQKRLESFRQDFAGAVKAMVRMLFHPDADPSLVAETERRMARTSPAAAYATLAGLAGYDVNAPARKLAVPLRAINGDLYPTNIQSARKVKPDFDAVLMRHIGHYPMLESPAAFEQHVARFVAELTDGK